MERLHEDEMIRCLLCTEEVNVARYYLKDHISGMHFDHAPHKCQDCKETFKTAELASTHAGETDHDVLLNEIPAEEQKAHMIKINYQFCLEKSRDGVQQPMEEMGQSVRTVYRSTSQSPRSKPLILSTSLPAKVTRGMKRPPNNEDESDGPPGTGDASHGPHTTRTTVWTTPFHHSAQRHDQSQSHSHRQSHQDGRGISRGNDLSPTRVEFYRRREEPMERDRDREHRHRDRDRRRERERSPEEHRNNRVEDRDRSGRSRSHHKHRGSREERGQSGKCLKEEK